MLPSLARLPLATGEKRARTEPTTSASEENIHIVFSRDVSLESRPHWGAWENGEFRTEIESRQEEYERKTKGCGMESQDSFMHFEEDVPGMKSIDDYIWNMAEAIVSLAGRPRGLRTYTSGGTYVQITSITEWVISKDRIEYGKRMRKYFITEESVLLAATVDANKRTETDYVNQILDLFQGRNQKAVELNEEEFEKLREDVDFHNGKSTCSSRSTTPDPEE